MRCLLAAIVGLGLLGLLIGGFVFTIVGFIDQREADHVYVVGFGHSGDDCGPEELTLDIDSGEALHCVTQGVLPIGEKKIELPGFTEAQNDEVALLVAQLSDAGLSAIDQREIQDLVDQFAADVPPSERPYPDDALIAWSFLWGARLGWLGVGMLATAAISYVVVMRRL